MQLRLAGDAQLEFLLGVRRAARHGRVDRGFQIVEVMLADDRRSWQLGKDGRWTRIEVLESREGAADTFAILKDDAAAAALISTDLPSRTHALAGSMDPRA